MIGHLKVSKFEDVCALQIKGVQCLPFIQFELEVKADIK